MAPVQPRFCMDSHSCAFNLLDSAEVTSSCPYSCPWRQKPGLKNEKKEMLDLLPLLAGGLRAAAGRRRRELERLHSPPLHRLGATLPPSWLLWGQMRSNAARSKTWFPALGSCRWDQTISNDHFLACCLSLQPFWSFRWWYC